MITLNCQGLNDFNKRKDVLVSYNILFQQGSHFNLFKTNSRGIAIFLNKNCEYEIHSEYKDENGKYLMLDVTVENVPLLLIFLALTQTHQFLCKLKGNKCRLSEYTAHNNRR